MKSRVNLTDLARLVRHDILISTTRAGSGHPTSSLSATDIMTVLFFKYLRFDLDHPENPNNDRVLFSKGHAAPLLYALFKAAGKISQEEILRLRLIDSPLEGHPTPRFQYAEVATGSLGQGLSAGVGMALNAKYLDHLPYITYVLLGDGEMAEGSVWEAVQIAAYYKLDNLLAIIDVNRFGQSQETMDQHQVDIFAAKLRTFGWQVKCTDGHSMTEITESLDQLLSFKETPKALVAMTLKGKGVKKLEDKPSFHGKALSSEDLAVALKDLGPVDVSLVGVIEKPTAHRPEPLNRISKKRALPSYKLGDKVATRQTYGETLSRLIDLRPEIISLDGDTKNSTYAECVLKDHPQNYFEMFIAEQNMIGVAVGLSKRGKIPFVSTFAAFHTRAFDQVRMAAVSRANIKCVGSHAGVAIGEDGPSQMGLEDIAMFRCIHGSTVLYPADGTATVALVRESVDRKGIVYLRTNRPATPILYPSGEAFPIGGSKIIKSSDNDLACVCAAGITLIESLKAYELLLKEKISIRVIDCYSIKPIDENTLREAASQTKGMIVVEDHWYEGGLGDAVLNALARDRSSPVVKLAVREMPRSGKPDELVDTYGLSARHIVQAVRDIL